MIKKIGLAAAIIGIILYSLNATKPDASAYSAKLNKSRSEKNRSFRQSDSSPLSAEQKAQFDSLKYYPAQLSFVIPATVSRNATPDTTLIQMSDNRAEKYLNWGTAKFEIDNKPQQLGIYLKATGQDSTLFIPFTDLTNGHETYGGGRYLDAAKPKLDATEIELDFNQAYNPYCAYNNEYSCPVPPAANRLQVAIPAGEKSFHE
ncbi:DUF1684 domain-containing protein [Hymenobacter sp. BT770]|uniref:DUF1684 domain-containing protein n=1 Tax=Hymenobacter sp. BT770 TaxID=2886942 RepID=UPI001D128353|nr:DUF1684 domain-containing protein [Hymenobacter sp. BT770]MCC3151607.1 DUF1684 domain-containing protein [Hymenobacter sp. BT770]MDO3413815.1 DUF1684 domain-containing protein [Hymenobacter sp. BT770]